MSESKPGGDGRPAKPKPSRSRRPKPAGDPATTPKRRSQAAKPVDESGASPKPRSRRKAAAPAAEVAIVSTLPSAAPPIRHEPAPALREAAVPGLEVPPAPPPASRNLPPAAARQFGQPLDARFLIRVDIGCLVVTAALAAAVALGGEGPVRLLLALAFTSFVPGWALVRSLKLADTATGAAMAVPSSLAICAGASVTMVWVHAWQPLLLLAALAIVSAAMIGWMLRVQLGSRRGANEALARW
jgi:hypothetical protein